MENSSDSNFVFGLVALAVIVLALLAWLYLAAPDTESVPVEPATTTIAP
jgi:hypothetical protein